MSAYATIKVRRKVYKNKPSVVVYFNDVTKKMRDKLRQIKQQECALAISYAESYKATLSHEMRTPVESCVLLLGQIITLISKFRHLLPNFFYERANNSLSMCIRKLNFALMFIEDMLGVNMANEGVLTLEKKPFDLEKVFHFIIDMFEPMMRLTEVQL